MGKALDRGKTIRAIASSIVITLLILFSVSTFVFIGQSELKNPLSTLTFTIHFEEPSLQETKLQNRTFTQVWMDNCITQAVPGEPALPVRPLKILIPQHKAVARIVVTNVEVKDIESELLINPIVPQQVPTSLENKGNNFPLLINEQVYTSEFPVFGELYWSGGIGYCRGYSILTVYLYPVQYIPRIGRMYYFPEVTLQIELDDKTQSSMRKESLFFREEEIDRKVIESLVINPDIVDSYTSSTYKTLSSSGLCNPSETYEYVIITNENLSNTSGYPFNWSDLLQHRTTYDGFNATKITVEAINNCSVYWNATDLFNDTAAHIREFLKDAYQNWGTQYVLLGGDWDDSEPGNQIIPARVFVEHTSKTKPEPDEYYDMPCDMYYSHLDGDWWDASHSCWGGGRNSSVNDHYGELYIGRLTVSSAEQISNVIKKIRWYDLSVDHEFVNKSAFFGGDLGAQFSVTSVAYLEEIRNGTDPHFYECKGFTEWNTDNPTNKLNISTRVYNDWGASVPADFITVINNDNACLINHVGHGTQTIALDMSTAQLETLNNSKFFFAYSQGCFSGRFTAGNTSEKTLICLNDSNGAFGLIFNTGYGWASGINTNGSNQFLQRQFWHYFFNNSATEWIIGAAHAHAQDELSVYVDLPWHYAWCYNWYSSHLFGDPAQKLKPSVPKQDGQISISNENPTNGTTGVPVGNVSLSITVADPEGDAMNITFSTNTSGHWLDVGTNNSQPNGTYMQIMQVMNYSTKYWWRVNVPDITGSSGTKNKTYSFITSSNQASLVSNENPTNRSTGVSLSKSTLTVTITDQEGDTFNWSIETQPNIGNSTGTNETNGQKSCSITGLSHLTTYYWFVNTTDIESRLWTDETFHFTTKRKSSRPRPSPAPPASQSDDNSPPSPPNNPSGPTEGVQNSSYNYSVSTTDPDNDAVRYQFDWGDSSVSDWTDFVESGSLVSVAHRWLVNGVFNVRVLVQDEHGAESSWSDALIVTMEEPPRILEEEPVFEIDIPLDMNLNQSLTFSIRETTELDTDLFTYVWSFGDGTTKTGSQPTHTYSIPGVYMVTLTVYENDEVVYLSAFEVTIPVKENVSEQKKAELTTPFSLWISLFCGGMLFVFLLFLRKIIIDFKTVQTKYFRPRTPTNGIKPRIQQAQQFRLPLRPSSYLTQQTAYKHPRDSYTSLHCPSHQPSIHAELSDSRDNQGSIDHIRTYIDEVLSLKEKQNDKQEK